MCRLREQRPAGPTLGTINRLLRSLQGATAAATRVSYSDAPMSMTNVLKPSTVIALARYPPRKTADHGFSGGRLRRDRERLVPLHVRAAGLVMHVQDDLVVARGQA